MHKGTNLDWDLGGKGLQNFGICAFGILHGFEFRSTCPPFTIF